MTTIYKFVCGYTKAGVATSPSSAPTITIVDSGNNILASAQATTARTNIAGVYDYSYSGADSLDLIGLFHTSDTTVDRQDLHSHPYDAVILASIATRLAPTIAGRTLDVSATGEAGIDWANVGSPTTVLALSNTTVGTVTTATNLTNNQAKYMHGAVWVNTVSGAAGSTSYVNGIMTNPSNSLATAKTIADNIFLKKFWIQAGSTIALSADMIGYVIEGSSWTLSSASARNLSGTLIRNCENLTGLYTSPTQECYVYDSQVGTSTWGEVDFHGCHIVGTITLNAALPFLFDRCTGIPINFPTINFGATADARSAVVKDYGGSLTVTNMRAGNVLYVDGNCQMTIDATCTGGTVYISGNIKLTNNGSGQTIVDTSRFDEDQLSSFATAANLAATQSQLEAYISAETAGLATSAAVGLVSSVVNTLPSATEIDAQLSGTHGSGTWGGAVGSGAITHIITINDGVNPIDGVDVWISTDLAGTSVVARGTTSALGIVTFYLDAGTYYAWKQLAGYDFTNPQSFTVS